MKERNYYLDFLRGAAAINIIIIHTAFWSGESYVPVIVKNMVLMVDIPFFFFLAGWSFAYVNSSIKALKGLVKIQKQYIFFLLLYSGILFFVSKEEVSWNNFIFNFFYFNKIQSKILPVVMGSIWFMPVYFSVVSIFSAILVVIKKAKDYSLYLILLAICLCGITYSQLGGNFFNISISILFYGFFYVLGFISKNYRISSIRALIAILALISALGFILKKIFIIDKIIVQNLKFPPHIIYLVLSLFSISIALYAKNRVEVRSNNFLVRVGNRAIFYYFGQGISSSLMFFVVKKINCIWQEKFAIVACSNIILAVIISEIIYSLYRISESGLKVILRKGKSKISFFLEKSDTVK